MNTISMKREDRAQAKLDVARSLVRGVLDATRQRAPMKPPLVKSPGAVYLTKQAALATVHSIDSTEAEHDAALATLTRIARAELLPANAAQSPDDQAQDD